VNFMMDLDLIRKRSPPAEKLAAGVAEFETYIRNNKDFIPNFGERYRQRRDDQHGLRRIDDQSGREQTVRQEATDGMDVRWSPSPVTDPDQGPE
jgi:hypothetical protein